MLEAELNVERDVADLVKGLKLNTACEIGSWIPAPYRKLIVIDSMPVPRIVCRERGS